MLRIRARWSSRSSRRTDRLATRLSLGPDFRVNSYTTDRQFQGSVAATPPATLSSLESRGQMGRRGHLRPALCELRQSLGTSSGQYDHDHHRASCCCRDGSGSYRRLERLRRPWPALFPTGAPLGPNSASIRTPLLAGICRGADPSGNSSWSGSDFPIGQTKNIFGRASQLRRSTRRRVPRQHVRVRVQETRRRRQRVGWFVVVWSRGNVIMPMGTNIAGQRYDSLAAPLGGEFLVNPPTAGSAHNPRVASDAAGNFIVVWRLTTSAVFARRYAASGVPLTPEFRVDSGATTSIFNPASPAPREFRRVWSAAGTPRTSSDAATRVRDAFRARIQGDSYNAACKLYPWWPTIRPAISSLSGAAGTRTDRTLACSASYSRSSPSS